MSKPQIQDLIELAKERVLAHGGKSLTDVQIAILEQILEGKRLKDVYVTGYGNSTIQQMYAPKLWSLLAGATGKAVSKSTVHLVLENLWHVQHGSKEGSTEKPKHGIDIIPPSLLPASPQIRHNLPGHSCTEFIGRKDEIERLLELLSPTHGARIISIDGIGGVGKTTLAVEAAYRCLRASSNPDEVFQGMPTFDAIIFTSAKQHILAPFGLIKRLNPKRTLRDILRQIASILGNVDLAGKSLDDQLDCLQEALFLQATLLIVDNLETIEDPKDVLSFLYDLPPTVKIVITTRKQIIFVPLRLASLPESDGLRLIRHEAQEKEVRLSQGENQELYRKTGGIPVAINYAIGQLASGRSVSHVLEQLANATGDVARFLFESSVAPLQEQNQVAYQLLMGLTFFSTPVRWETLAEVALVNNGNNLSAESRSQIVRNALARLQELSLVGQEQDHYTMLPLTQEYAIAELKKHPDLEKAVRGQWIDWWLRFVDQHGNQEIWDWRQQNDLIEAEWSNIQTVIEWCLLEERHVALYQLWRGLDAHIHLQGNRSKRSICWGDRLDWTKQLIEIATQNGDFNVAAEVMVSRGWLLTTMGQREHLDEADQILTHVWSDFRHRQTPSFQLGLAIDISALRFRQGRLDEAQTWLEQAVDLLENNTIEDTERLPHLSRLEYYKGRIQFDRGEYERAKRDFTSALAAAHAAGWQQGIHRITNWLADVAAKQREFDRAQQLLTDNLQIAEASKDIYRIGFCQRSLANLAEARNDQQGAYDWAVKALDNFRRLDMLSEAEETCTFLQTLNVEFP